MTELEEYPGYWPCHRCGHKKREHGYDITKTYPTMCKIKNNNGSYVDSCTVFKPMDNLTYVELEEAERHG